MLALVLAVGCQSPPPDDRSRAPSPSAGFDAERASAHLEALTDLGPRVMGSEGSERALAYLRGELDDLDIESEEQLFIVPRNGGTEQSADFITLRNLIAAIPGDSRDVFVLMAPYDTGEHGDDRFLAANEGSSGAAVLLELARTIAKDPLPYTVWVVFLDGEALRSERDASARRHLGSQAFARSIRPLMERLRLAVALERVCATDLRIARDQRSRRSYRDEFWRVAPSLGHGDAFPLEAPFESPQASHLALLSAGFRNVVALVDTRFGGEPTGAATEADGSARCSQESLAAVGEVTLEALDRIGTRMARVDRLSGRTAGDGKTLLEQLPIVRAIRWSDFNEMVLVQDADGIRQLANGPTHIIQSAMDLEQPERLVMPYTQIASILMSLHPSPRRVFNIGLGGGVLSRFHLHRYPESEVESVEIDPVILDLAEEYFEVLDPRHTILEADGAAALMESSGGFDVIVVDAGSDRSGIPEVFREMRFIDSLPRKLEPQGVVVANLWAEEPAAFEKLVADYKKNFSYGVLVAIPGASNSIAGFSDSPSMNCSVFFETLEQWAAEGLADLEWTERDAPSGRPCRDL